MHATLAQMRLGASLVLAITLGVSACENDNNPYGPAYRSMYSIIGAYRPAELLHRTSQYSPGKFQTAADGSDKRISVGSARTVTGRVFIPGGAVGGADLETYLFGTWTYNVPQQELTVHLDPTIPISPPLIVFQITFETDRIKLHSSTTIDGVPVEFDLAKPLPPEDRPESGGGNIPSFNKVPGRG